MPPPLFKPMLAGTADLGKLTFPVYASPKLDGVRCVVKEGRALSRSLKPIPNAHIARILCSFEGIDGEIIVGDPCAKDVFQKTVSAVMSEDGEPDFQFYAFDSTLAPDKPYWFRWEMIRHGGRVQRLSSEKITDLKTLQAYEAAMVGAGYEGIMVRSTEAPYKFGRSTVKEGYLLKVKRFVDAEAMIYDFEPKYRNDNPPTTNELGRTVRASNQENLVALDMLGALKVKSPEWGNKEFAIGTGFTDEQRKELWTIRGTLRGAVVTFKYQPTGTKDVPRIPVFLRIKGDATL